MYGGGIFNNTGGTPTVINSLFSGNTADDAGGGMYNAAGVTLKVINCVFDGNKSSGDADGSEGGALYLAGPTTVTNCTFSNNTVDDLAGSPAVGGAMWLSTVATVDNCVMWGDTASDGGDEIYVRADGTLTIDFSDPEGGEAAVFVESGGGLTWGDDNIGELPTHDPKFASAGSGNLHIKPGSPCIDAAINTAPGLVGITTDLDGSPRFVEDPDTINCRWSPDPADCGTPPIADMGAYEFQLCPGASGTCPWDLFPEAGGDGEIGPGDLAVLLGNWGLNPGHQADFDCNSFVGAFDLANLLGNWGPCP